MKHNTLLILALLLAANLAVAAGVKLERLEDFDPGIHKISVNVEVGVKGGCVVDPVELEQVFTGLLGVFGFQTASMDESELEFAVSVKGIPSPGQHPCGLKLLSMARQIPDIKMLRLSPGSTSQRYRIWTAESIISSTQDDVESLLAEQARKDVLEFTRTLKH